MKIGDLIEVEWWDAVHPEGVWSSPDEVSERLTRLAPCLTAGYLVARDRNYLVIASTIDRDVDGVTHHLTGEMAIPRRMIHASRALAPKKAPNRRRQPA